MTPTAMLLCLCIAADAPTEHPYAKAKVGDSITYKMTMPGMPNMPPNMAGGMTMKKTVTAKTDDTVTLKLENSVGDMVMPPQEIKINLKEKFDPTQSAKPPQMPANT